MLKEDQSEGIQIEGPPIHELEKKTSCLKRSCLVAGGCLFLIIIAIIGIVWFYQSTGTKKTQSIPSDFPSAIPIYDQKNINIITVDPARLPPNWITALSEIIDSRINFSTKNFYQKKFNTHPENIVTIEWDGLPAQPNFVAEFYIKALRKINFSVEDNSRNAKGERFLQFSSSTITARLQINDDTKLPGTDLVILIVKYQPDK